MSDDAFDLSDYPVYQPEPSAHGDVLRLKMQSGISHEQFRMLYQRMKNLDEDLTDRDLDQMFFHIQDCVECGKFILDYPGDDDNER